VSAVCWIIVPMKITCLFPSSLRCLENFSPCFWFPTVCYNMFRYSFLCILLKGCRILESVIWYFPPVLKNSQSFELQIFAFPYVSLFSFWDSNCIHIRPFQCVCIFYALSVYVYLFSFFWLSMFQFGYMHLMYHFTNFLWFSRSNEILQLSNY
jgi:hypothetical protein